MSERINFLGYILEKRALPKTIFRVIENEIDSLDKESEILLLSKNTENNELKNNFTFILTDNKDFKYSNYIYIDDISPFKNGDIISCTQIDNKVFIKKIFRSDSLDNAFFLTNLCNSDCVFCPDSSEIRSQKKFYTKEVLESIPLYPKNLLHATITGGEPTLLKEDFFEILSSLKKYLPETNYTLLTNGRMFFYNDFSEKFKKVSPDKIKIAIPIHGSNKELHDRLTGVSNSFLETIIGIKNLYSLNFNLEIRVVLNKQNYKDLDNIIDIIIKYFPNIKEFNIMSLELMGNAAKNYKEFWLNKNEIDKALKPAILKLVKNKINVQLYNFPLCYLNSSYWPLSRKSITDYKQKFSEDCSICLEKNNCGGFFNSTFNMLNADVYPIIGG